MATQGESNQQRANRQRAHQRAAGRYDREGVHDQTPTHSEYCAVCFLTFGSQEERAVWRGKVAHVRCAGKLRPAEAA